MSLSPAQVRVIVSTGAFDDAIRNAVTAINALTPLLSRLRVDRQRDRSRLVTRRKQRRTW